MGSVTTLRLARSAQPRARYSCQAAVISSVAKIGAMMGLLVTSAYMRSSPVCSMAYISTNWQSVNRLPDLQTRDSSHTIVGIVGKIIAHLVEQCLIDWPRCEHTVVHPVSAKTQSYMLLYFP